MQQKPITSPPPRAEAVAAPDAATGIRSIARLMERWTPRIVVAPSFAASLFFVYGFIAWTFYISFTHSGVLPDYGFAGLGQGSGQRRLRPPHAGLRGKAWAVPWRAP